MVFTPMNSIIEIHNEEADLYKPIKKGLMLNMNPLGFG